VANTQSLDFFQYQIFRHFLAKVVRPISQLVILREQWDDPGGCVMWTLFADTEE